MPLEVHFAEFESYESLQRYRPKATPTPVTGLAEQQALIARTLYLQCRAFYNVLTYLSSP